ncbi:tRNA U-34 5-methylaminomethyl-2-thiouridine biosynthesis protein [Bacillus sp. FSL H8-0547]
MKGLFLAILGAITAWGVFGFFQNDFETDSLFALIIGIVIGFNIRKKETGVSK